LNHDIILAVLSDSKNDAKSLKEIANEMGLDISRYVMLIGSIIQFFKILDKMGLGGFGAKAERRRSQVLV